MNKIITGFQTIEDVEKTLKWIEDNTDYMWVGNLKPKEYTTWKEEFNLYQNKGGFYINYEDNFCFGSVNVGGNNKEQINFKDLIMKTDKLDVILNKLDEISKMIKPVENTTTYAFTGEAPTDSYDNLRKLIGRSGDTLAIMGDKMLKSINWTDGATINYDNKGRENYTGKVNFEETTIDKLQYGDLFVPEEDKDTTELKKVNIFVGTDDDGIYCMQYIEKYKGNERITYDCYDENTKVIKALRN